MAFTTLTLGLTLTIPTNGTKNWGTTLKTTTWTKISNHNHTGSGDGNQMVTGSYTNDSVTDPKIRLTNAGWLRSRNQAGSADVNLIRLNTSNEIELGASTFNFTGQWVGKLAATVSPVGTTQTLDFLNGNAQKIDLSGASGDVTLTFSNSKAGGKYLLLITQGGTFRDLVFPAAVKWPQGQVPILSQDSGAIDKIEFFYDGTNYYGDWELNYA